MTLYKPFAHVKYTLSSLQHMVEYTSEIDRLEAEIKKTQYNKATQHHIGLIKAKIARLREKEIARGKSSGPKTGYSVRKTGDGTVILLGFPSTGKSTLLNKLCNTKSDTASYAFTTVSVIPGTMEHKHARIQILDVPGIVEGASSGRGRGKEVLGCIRSADLCLIIVDATRPEELAAVLQETTNAGIRLNARRPDVHITKSATGGINVLTTKRLTLLDNRTIKEVMREFKITNADVLIREDITVDQLIDCIEDNKKYLPGIIIFNKADLINTQEKKRLEKKYHPDLFVSAELGENISPLREIIYDALRIINVFLKEPGKEADLKEPLVLFRNATIRDLCEKLHKDFTSKFKFARVWGESAKFDGQKLMLAHTLTDGDIVEIHLS